MPETIDTAAIERLLAAAVAYREACKATDLGWMAHVIAVDAASAKVLAIAEAIATPARLSAWERAVLDAAMAFRDGEFSDIRDLDDRLLDAAMQPEEAADAG